MQRECIIPPRNPHLRLVTSEPALPMPPRLPGAYLRRRAWRLASVAAAGTFAMWAAVGAAMAALFACFACSVLLAVLNRSERSLSSNLD